MKHLLDTEYKIHVSATGAGAGIQDALWQTPGCSKYFVGAVFPYGRLELIDYLGFEPEKFCSVETAMDMAMASYMRALRHIDGLQLPAMREAAIPLGIGVSAAVTSLRPRRGDNEFNIAIVLPQGVWTYTEKLERGVSRSANADRVHTAVLQTIDTVTQRYRTMALTYASDLARERLFAHPYFTASGAREKVCPPAPELFPGAFNPPHAGHFAMSHADTVFHITADAPHKEPLSVQAMLRRAVWLRGRNVLFSQGDRLYIEKARRHPGCSFLIGADAALRMLDPKWGVDVESLLQEFCELNVKFFVSARRIDGLIKDFADVWLCIDGDGEGDMRFRRLFQPGTCSSEHLGTSSSQIREGA